MTFSLANPNRHPTPTPNAAQGAMVGVMTSMFPAQLVIRAAGATALATGSLSAYAMTTKRDFTASGGMLAAGAITLIGLSIAQLLFGGSMLNTARVFIGTMLMCVP